MTARHRGVRALAALAVLLPVVTSGEQAGTGHVVVAAADRVAVVAAPVAPTDTPTGTTPQVADGRVDDRDDRRDLATAIAAADALAPPAPATSVPSPAAPVPATSAAGPPPTPPVDGELGTPSPATTSDVVPTPSPAPAVVALAPPPEPEPSPAPAPPPVAPPSPWTELHGSLETRALALPGPVAAQVLRWRLGDPAVRVRVDDADVPGRLATVPDAASSHDAVAAVNGGFWVDADDPDGWFLSDGRLRSDTTTGRWWRRNRRGGFGLAADGRAVVGVPEWTAAVEVDGVRMPVRGLNRRAISPGEVLLFTDGVWAQPPVTGGQYFRVPRPGRLDVTQEVTLPIVQRSGNTIALDPDHLVVWFDDEAARSVDSTADELHLSVLVASDWQGLDQGLTGGPWLIGAGTPTLPVQWRHEGFDAAHTDARHPRTAFGVTGDGHGVVLVVDGRQPGHSVGMTVPEVTAALLDLGVTDAVMLDGGGSSQLAVGGGLANRPCCDASLRRVATVLLFERG